MHARFGVQRWRRTNNCAEVFEDPLQGLQSNGGRPFYDEKKNETLVTSPDSSRGSTWSIPRKQPQSFTLCILKV
jgi:hypothetical protein